MPRIKNDNLVKHKIGLFAGDHAKMQGLYPNIGAGPAIRNLVRAHIRKAEAVLSPIDIDLSTETLEDVLNVRP